MNKQARITTQASYDGDFHRWTVEQGRFLREKRFDLVDWENVAEEIETLGRSERNAIESRLAVALAHLLKWQAQREKRKGGWEATIRLQRRKLAKLIRENPSLNHYPAEILAEAWLEARLKATDETGIEFDAFPETCPFTIEQVFDEAFLPS